MLRHSEDFFQTVSLLSGSSCHSVQASLELFSKEESIAGDQASFAGYQASILQLTLEVEVCGGKFLWRFKCVAAKDIPWMCLGYEFMSP